MESVGVGDRAYMQPERIAAVIEAGADIVVRSGWRNARWLRADGAPVGLLTEFENAGASGQIGKPIWIGRESGPALALRLVAVKKPPQAAEAARRAARQVAKKKGHTIPEGTLTAADWVKPKPHTRGRPALRLTTSQPRSLLSIARLKSAKSRTFLITCKWVRIAQTCLG
jgi:hypothetical protein